MTFDTKKARESVDNAESGLDYIGVTRRLLIACDEIDKLREANELWRGVMADLIHGIPEDFGLLPPLDGDYYPGSARDRVFQAMDKLRAQVAKRDEALTTAAKRFEEYVWIHRKKGTAHGEEKARENQRMADMCRAALAAADELGKGEKTNG